MRFEKVVIIDDDSEVLQMGRAALMEIGFSGLRIDQYSSATEYLEVVKLKEPPDLLITDIRMPRMSGVEMLKELEAMNELSMKVLILSQVAPEDFQGVFLQKPILMRDFIRAMQAAVLELLDS